MSPRRQYLLFFGLVVAVIGAAFVFGRSRAYTTLLDTVPHDAWFVATVDIAALRASPLAKPILGGGEKTPIPGLGPLVARCGFDPVARVRELVVTAPENGERGDFGVAFSGDFTKDELSKCAENVIRGRGGSPATSTRGGFTLVEDTSDASHARLAYRDGGPFLVGSGAWLDAMIDATERKTERLRPEHTELRAALAGKSGATPAIVVTALLPASVRDKLKAELGPELAGAGDKTYAGVLAVKAAGVAVRLGGGPDPASSTTELSAELRCETDSSCDEVKSFIERKRLAFGRDLTVRLVGLGPLLDSLAVDGHGAALSATARAPTDELARGIQRVIDFKSRPAPAPAPAPSGSGP